VAAAFVVVLAWLALAPRALSATNRSMSATNVSNNTTTGTTTPSKPTATATLTECETAVEPAERSATFSGEMATLPGATKMEMRIDVLQRLPSEEAFRAVVAPGLGVWRSAAPGVKSFKYLKQVTNLAAPAVYRAAIRFRWLNAKGKLMKSLELRTPRCAELARATTETPTTGETTPQSGAQTPTS
jgi:hypothetical protein